MRADRGRRLVPVQVEAAPDAGADDEERNHDPTENLADQAPGTEITWVVRRAQVGQLFGGEESDALPERGRLGTRARQLVDSSVVRYTSLRIAELRRADLGLVMVGEDGEMLGPIDEIVCATGFRPDLVLTRELRLDLDAAVEAPSALAPLIDPRSMTTIRASLCCPPCWPRGVEAAWAWGRWS